MNVDIAIPALLIARGLSRVEAAAALRNLATRDYWGGGSIPEAQYVVQRTLGARGFSWNDNDLAYDIPLAEGVSLIKDIDGDGHYSGHGNFIVTAGKMPATLINSLSHGKLGAIVKHPQLSEDIQVGTITVKDDRTWIQIFPVRKDVALLLPATERDMYRAVARWRRLRTRELVEAEAIRGMSPDIMRTTGLRFLAVAAVATAAWMIMDDTLRAHPIGVVMTVILALSWIGWKMRRDMLKPDRHLGPRLQALRERRIDEQAASIGGETK